VLLSLVGPHGTSIELIDGKNRIDYCDTCGLIWPIHLIAYVEGPDVFECEMCRK
jgi:hypothetical protein